MQAEPHRSGELQQNPVADPQGVSSGSGQSALGGGIALILKKQGNQQTGIDIAPWSHPHHRC
jgi:hypothetical protein